jgi:dephospho-CoA kinase
MCDYIWVVTLEQDVAVQRLQKRDGLSEIDARSRLDAQLAPEERLAYADVILRNEGTMNDLISKTKQALAGLRSD